MEPIRSLETIHLDVKYFETFMLIVQIEGQPKVRAVVFIGEQTNGKWTVYEEGKGLIEIDEDPKTRFICGSSYLQREVIERYYIQEIEKERRAKELSKKRKDRKRDLKKVSERFHEL